MKKFLVAGALLLLPSLALGAGFAKQSLFLSKMPVIEGDTVLIHAVVANDTSAKFTGTVVFKDADVKIGSVAVAIAAGGANTESISWKPSAGSHAVSAELTDTDGTVVEKESANFTIEKKQSSLAFADSASSAAAVESSQEIQDQIGSLSPTAEQVSKPAFTVIDGLRSSAAEVVDSQIANAKQKLADSPKSGIVEGVSTMQDPVIQNPWGNVWTVLYTLYLYILTVVRFLIGNAGVFYPLLALIFLYILWRMYRRFRRPAWER